MCLWSGVWWCVGVLGGGVVWWCVGVWGNWCSVGIGFLDFGWWVFGCCFGFYVWYGLIGWGCGDVGFW